MSKSKLERHVLTDAEVANAILQKLGIKSYPRDFVRVEFICKDGKFEKAEVLHVKD